jgi:putative peptidoglycan lipid II flippase
MTLVSRILGFVRDVMTVHVLGVNWASGTFVLAWVVPNLLRRLLGEGALSAAFVPAFAGAGGAARSPRGRELLAGVSGAVALAIGGTSLLVVLASFVLPPEIWHLEGDGGVDRATRGTLMWELTRTLFPYALPVCLLALYAGAANTLGVFALPAAAPAVLNLFWIGGLVLAAGTAGDDVAAVVRTVAWALTIGGVVQLGLGMWPLWRRGMLPLPRIPRPGDGTKEVFAAMAPAALGLSLVQVNMLVDQALAEFLIGPGANNHIYLANRLLLFPHALVALPLATAVFPSLASAASMRDTAALSRRLDQAVRYTLLLSLPATVGMVLVSGDLVETAFAHGRYTVEDAADTRLATIALVAGLPALGTAQLYARALYPTGDTRTPARVAAILVFINLGLVLLLVVGLELGVAAFTLATTCTSVLNVALLRRVLGQRGAVAPTRWPAIARLALATALMAACVALLVAVLPSPAGRGQRALLRVVLPIALGVATFAGASRLLGVAEFGELLGRLRRRR